MQLGKSSTTIIKRSILSYMHGSNPAGVDCAALKLQGDTVYTATAVGTDDVLMTVGIAVIRACNNIYASGGRPIGIEAAYLIPAQAREIRIKEVTKEILRACTLCDTQLVGGHTEVTDAVNRIVVTITAIGVPDERYRTGTKPLHIKSVQPGMDIVMTKWAGLEAAAVYYAHEDRRAAYENRFSPAYVAEMAEYYDWLSIGAEAAVAMQHGAQAMHDVSEGGIFTALWELAEGSGCGFVIDLPDIPMRQPVVELMELENENIYRANSSGSLLIVTTQGEELVKALEESEIPSCIIGQTTDNRDKILQNIEEIRYLDRG